MPRLACPALVGQNHTRVEKNEIPHDPFEAQFMQFSA